MRTEENHVSSCSSSSDSKNEPDLPEEEEKMDEGDANDNDEQDSASDADLGLSESLEQENDDNETEDTDESNGDQVIPLHEQKSKLKVFEKCLNLISDLYDSSLTNSSFSPQPPKFAHKLKLNFFHKCLLDHLSLGHVKNILLAIMRLSNGACSNRSARLSRENLLLASKFVAMCCKSIRKLQEKSEGGGGGSGESKKGGVSSATTPITVRLEADDRCVPFYTMLGSLLVSSDDESVTETDTAAGDYVLALIGLKFTDLIVAQLFFLLIQCAPYHTLQWLVSVSSTNRQVEGWLLSNLERWTRELLIEHRHTNVRFSAALLLAQLVPNRAFRLIYSQNRNMLMPYNFSAGNKANLGSLEPGCSELDLKFESEECKKVLKSFQRFIQVYRLSVLFKIIKSI